MTFERITLEQRLKRLHEIRENLREVAATIESDFVADFHHYWLAERGLQLGAEVVLDIGNHVLATVFSRYPETNEETLSSMHECGVISPELYDQLKGYGGLRNILVHGYLRVDASQVYEHAQKAPDVLAMFSQEILAWMDAHVSQ
jgi:uncharacterized protein YutE (UPF0331/DUF86 family)